LHVKKAAFKAFWTIAMRHIVMALGAFCLALPVQAASNDEAGERMICKYRQETGTRFKAKVCKTAAQWEEMAENNRSGLKEMVDRPQIEIRK
jgi:hypothetical protein